MTTQTTTISAQIPMSLANQLSTLARAENRSKSYYIKESLKSFINNKMEDVTDYLESEKIYKEFVLSGEKGITMSELEKKYNL